MSDVGGLPHLVERLTRAVTRPLEHPEALARLGLTPARGVLLHGPPGCSKTTIVRAVAGTTRASFHYLSGAEIYSPFVGEAERAIRAFFDLGRATAPSLLFLDEIDALVGKRDGAGGGGGDSVQLRVLSTLLNEMDGVEPLNQVVLLGATNRLDMLDAALLRPGRFDEATVQRRRRVLAVHTRSVPLSSDVRLDAVADAAAGWTGAELADLCREAAMFALREDLQAGRVAARHFDAAFLQAQGRQARGRRHHQ
uniref:AAA+ ATPase domain-containing protein n=1 Tax=Emiliania huxleyi (strain CCMP1516) TaxID=280463 RepID=A0A0D3JMB7_EMIH1